MKHLIIILLFFTATTIRAQTLQQEIPAAYGYIVTPGQSAPDFTTVTTKGKTVSLSNLKGKIVMLQFTASWCSVCRKEMPRIEQEIWQKHKDNPDFLLFGIDLKEPAAKAEGFRKEIPVTYPMLLDPEGTIFYSYAGKDAGVTRNVIIDRDGKIVFLTRLYKEDEFNAMKTVIEKLLNEH